MSALLSEIRAGADDVGFVEPADGEANSGTLVELTQGCIDAVAYPAASGGTTDA